MSPEEAVEAAMLARLAERAGRNVDPTDVARAVAGPHPDQWGRLMPVVRRVAVRLAKAGRIVILRKGRVADPEDFRGTYRLALAAVDGPGNGESIRPEK